MENFTLDVLFYNTCDQFVDHNAIIYLHNTHERSFKYGQLKRLIGEISIILHDHNVLQSSKQFIGLTSHELNPEMIAFIIAIIKADNSFVFVDLSSPNIFHLLDHLNVKWIIGETKQKNLLPADLITDEKTFKLLENDFTLWELKHHVSSSKMEIKFAFAVMSSGSTGEPKIIKVTHESIVPNVLELRTIYKIQSDDVIYISTPLTFDPCILDIFLALHSGATILLPSNEIKFDQKFLSKIFSSIVTIWYTTPSVFLKFFPQIEQTSLRVLILGGEKFPELDPKMWPFLKDVDIYNIYGITEVSCWASVFKVEDYSSVSLGRTLSDIIFKIELDFEGGNFGELLIGSQRRKCVINDVADILNDKLLFRATGDLVKIVNEEYYYVGRKDRRIKLFGHLIDLSAIESSILKHSIVKCCSCFFVEKENKVIAFVETYNEEKNLHDLREYLKEKLPSIMIPSTIYVERIPMNRHGKICERSCKQLYHKLKVASEKNILGFFKSLWKKYSGHEDTSLGFIDSGGNSIQALQFITDLSDICHIPRNFIALLLSNKTFDECWELVRLAPLIKFSKKTDHLPESSQSDFILTNEGNDNDPIPKKLKSSSFDNLTSIKCKGKTICYGNIHQKPLENVRNLKIRWKHDMEKCVDSSPTVVEYENTSIVICASHSGLIVIADLNSGQKITEIKLPHRIESSAAVSTCGKFFFIGCYDKNIYCISITDGSICWSYETDGIVKSIPLLSEKRLYFGSYDHNFYCLSEKTGSLIWKINIDDSSILGVPVLSQKIAVATLGGTIAILGYDGVIIKRTSFKEKHFFSSPLKLPKKEQFIVIDVTGTMFLFDLNSGYQLWKYQINGNVFSSINLIDSDCTKIVFGSENKNVYCFQILENTLKLIWERELSSGIYSTPFGFWTKNQENFHVFTSIVVASTDGHIYILDDEGKCVLECFYFGHVYSSPVVQNNFILIGSRDNFLYCLEIT